LIRARLIMMQEDGEWEEPEGPAQLDDLLSQDLLTTDRSVTMDDEETEQLLRIPMPELEPLLEDREIACWVDDPVPMHIAF